VPFKQIEKNKQKKTHIFGGPSCFRPGNPIQVEICRKRHQVGPNKMKQFLRIFLLAKRKKKKKSVSETKLSKTVSSRCFIRPAPTHPNCVACWP
jgi:hypothetical protein